MDMNVVIDQPDQTIRFEIMGIEQIAVMGLLREMLFTDPVVKHVPLEDALEIKRSQESHVVSYPTDNSAFNSEELPAPGLPLKERSRVVGECTVNCPECGETYQREAISGKPLCCRNCNTALYPKLGANFKLTAERRFVQR